MAKHKLSKKARQDAALKHVKHLVIEADKAFRLHPEYSHAYAKEALRICARVNLRLPTELKRRFCRSCKHFLVPGVNQRIRTTDHHLVITCLDCGRISRYGYLKEQKAKRRLSAQAKEL